MNSTVKALRDDQKIRVLFYTGHCQIVGGDAKFIIELVDHLDQDRFRSHLYTDKNKLFSVRLEQWRETSFPVTYLPTKPAVDSSFSLSRFPFFEQRIFGRRLSSLIEIPLKIVTFQKLRIHLWNLILFLIVLFKERNNFDILHVNNGGYPAKESCIIAGIAAKMVGVKVILCSIHNIPVHRSILRPAGLIFDFLVPRVFDQLIPACEAVKTEAVARRGFRKELMTTIYCGLEDRDPLSLEERSGVRQSIGLTDEHIAILLCGNIEEPRKGHQWFFRVIQALQKKHPQIRLLVAGSGSKERESVLRSFTKTLGIEQNVVFLGYRSDIHQLNAAVDLVAVPSTEYEATPYTIKEAQRAGTAVITTTAGGCAEAVTHGVTGLIVTSGDVEGTAACLRPFLQQPSSLKEMGANGRKYFLDHFEINMQTKKVEALYRQTLAKKSQF